MATLSDTQTTTELALAFQPAGFEEIPAATILTRLNYYDGKFLRADDLRLEQDYLRRLAELGARAGGAGLVYGFDVALGSGDELTIGGGLGFDPAGRALYLPGPFSIALQTLVDATAQGSAQAFALSEGTSGFAICEPDTPATPTASGGAEFYLITIAHAEEACGDEEVFGKLCDDGCATSMDRAYLVEGVVARARPYRPTTPFVSSKVVQLTELHIRSQLVSAAFADESLAVPSLISKAGLLSGAWCTGAAAPSGWEVPVAIVGTLSASRFVDEWVVRRERMDTPPRRYWAWTMAMRPWEAYLAQILQFQCQLPSALSGQGGSATLVDPCVLQRDALGEAVRYIGQLQVAVAAQPVQATLVGTIDEPAAPAATAAKTTRAQTAAAKKAAAAAAEPVVQTLSADPAAFLSQIGGIARLQNLQLQLTDVLRQATTASQRILVDGGIVELPPAGYLPVTPGTTPPVDVQVRRLLGDGVDLRFCVTTPDYIPHALEKAQHMDRISLLQGLDNPNDKPPVDILVPAGVLGSGPAHATGWDAQVAFSSRLLGFTNSSPAPTPTPAPAAPTNAPTAAPSAPSAPSTAPSAAGTIGERTNVGTLGELESLLQFHGVARTAPGTGTGGEVEFAGPGSLVLGTGNAAASVLAGYASATFDTNPFTLGVGATFTVTAQGAIARRGTALTNVSNAQLQGTASVTFTVQTPPQQTATGLAVTASGTLQGSGTESGSSSATRSGTASTPISLQITQTQQTPPAYEVAITPADPASSGEILLWASWQGSPLTVQAAGESEQTAGTQPPVGPAGGAGDAVGLTETPLTDPAAAVKLVENADVFSASNQLNANARQALQMLADALQDTQYTGALATKLFDPTAPGGSASGITATLDWVLFQRRRQKDCQTAQATPVPTKTYSVWVADAESSAQLKFDLSAVLQDNAPEVSRAGFRPAGTVTFAGGTATLTTSTLSILSTWKAAQPDALIAAAVIATNEVDETVSLLQNRVLAYQSAVSSVSKPGPNEQVQNRPALTSLPSGGVDGQIVLITMPAATICHHVYLAPAGGDAAGLLRDLDQGVGIDDYLKKVSNLMIDLGTITFQDATATVATSSLQTLTNEGYQSDVPTFVVVTQAGTSPSEPLSDQAGAIVTAIGGTASYNQVDTVAAAATVTWPAADCPIISILVAESAIT